VVGEGGFCQVRVATHHLSCRKVAVKVIDKTKLSDANEASRIQREVRVLKRLNHAAIIRLFEVLEAGPRLFLVMEYAPAGSLLDYVRGRKRLGEGEAAYFLQQIVAGLQYCHDNEVSSGSVLGSCCRCTCARVAGKMTGLLDCWLLRFS
jgi:5'-AMP-activated protein kinase catalytic alpha subunit